MAADKARMAAPATVRGLFTAATALAAALTARSPERERGHAAEGQIDPAAPRRPSKRSANRTFLPQFNSLLSR
jgi:hypothetical protein